LGPFEVVNGSRNSIFIKPEAIKIGKHLSLQVDSDEEGLALIDDTFQNLL
jgi:hypothetical protein